MSFLKNLCIPGLLGFLVQLAAPRTAQAQGIESRYRCVDESESGGLLSFVEEGPGVIRIRVNESLGGDYPGFAIEASPRWESDVLFRLGPTPEPVSPSAWSPRTGWTPVAVLVDPDGVSFHVHVRGARTVLRLWSSCPGDVNETALDSARGGGGRTSRSQALNKCGEACYAPDNAFCYDFSRIRCYVNFAARQPHVQVGLLGWTQPCPGEESTHWPREIYKMRITDESIPRDKKTRILLTSRVHGGERLASFIVEGLIDYALGLPVEGASGLLPPVPRRPDDLLEKLEIVVYPCLNPDGSADLNGDGTADFSRFKCGVDMNRRWGTFTEETEAHEVYLVHQDILREAQLRPFRYHRDFHGWSRPNQGGLRHGVGIWPDEVGFEAIQVSEEYFARESAILDAEHAVIPYRDPDNYLVGSPRAPPTPGTARFSLFRELSETGLITNTSESSWLTEDGEVASDPAYVDGDDLRLEGAWLLHAWYQTLPELTEPEFQFVRGDANADGNVNVSDMVQVLSHLFRGTALYCREPADVDEDGQVLLTDAVYLITFAFLGGPPPAAPYPACAPPRDGNPEGCKTRPSSCL